MNTQMPGMMKDMTTMILSSSPFKGEVVNGGTVAQTETRTSHTLSLSDDFVVPNTPAPHWQVVDRMGNVFLLNRLMIEGDRYNRTITVPSYVKDIAKVQIWCAWAEAVLGEASF
jgi:hypothetical protein